MKYFVVWNDKARVEGLVTADFADAVMAATGLHNGSHSTLAGFANGNQADDYPAGRWKWVKDKMRGYDIAAYRESKRD